MVLEFYRFRGDVVVFFLLFFWFGRLVGAYSVFTVFGSIERGVSGRYFYFAGFCGVYGAR